MDIEERKKKAIEVIDQQISELDRIGRRAFREDGIKLGRERMKRWKERTVKRLHQSVSSHEGEKFQLLRKTAWSVYPEKNFADEAQMYKNALLSLKEEVAEHPDSVFSQGEEQSGHIEVSSEGLIVAGQYYDALKSVTDILAKAQKSIVIVDRYVDDDILSLFPQDTQTREIKILTQSVSDKLKKMGIAFSKQYGDLSMRTSDAFHDRFVIIDGEEYYHFGPSIDEHLGKRYAMFSRIQEPVLVNQLQTAFEEEWNKSKIVIGIVPPR